MIKHKDQRVGVFVDVQNMYYSARNLFDSKVNFANVLESAVAERKLIRAIAYVIKSDSGEEQAFFEALDKQGFEVQMKDLQIFFGGMKKGDWDVGIAVDTFKMSSALDVIILVTGDGDFAPLVKFLQYHGNQVEVIAFSETTSAKLIEACDNFVDLSADKRKYLIKNRSYIKKDIKVRPTINNNKPKI
jgi:uncharacterized protein (TIGR00288 family)